jgi:sugar lactone lactonase YvrE
MRLLYFVFFIFLRECNSVKVWGQNNDLTSMLFGISQSTFGTNPLYFPHSYNVNQLYIDIDKLNGGLIVGDKWGARVLYYAPNNTIAAQSVVGQINFTSQIAGPAQNIVSAVNFVKSDISGGLYVSDTQNNRVIYFPPEWQTSLGINATRVYGQNDFNSFAFYLSYTNSGFNNPSGIAVDPQGNLYVADALLYSTRILFFPLNSTTATKVFFSDNFTANLPGFLSNNVGGIAVDNSSIYVADCTANRVYIFDLRGTLKYTIGNDILNCPVDVAIDKFGNIYVADRANRVLFFKKNSLLIAKIYTYNFSSINSIAVDEHYIYVADNSRVIALELDLTEPEFSIVSTSSIIIIVASVVSVVTGIGLISYFRHVRNS